MKIDEVIDRYLVEMDIDKVLKSLFDGKTKRKALIKKSSFIDKLLGIFVDVNSIDGELGLNADAMRDVLDSEGFTDEEIKAIREVVIKASKTVSRYIANKYKMKVSEIPSNFGVYTVVNMSLSDSKMEKEFNDLLKKQVYQRLNKI